MSKSILKFDIILLNKMWYGQAEITKSLFGNQGIEDKDNNMELLKIIAAIILPPVGVFLQVGIGMHFWLNILLTILGYIPGIVHAIWVIAKNK